MTHKADNADCRDSIGRRSVSAPLQTVSTSF